MRRIFLASALSIACSSSGSVGDDASPPVDGGATLDVMQANDASSADSADAFEAGPPDPCPMLSIPPTCANRDVVYREWSPKAKGDGTYFVGQEPWRLGFNRLQNKIWIVKFKTDANTYFGRVSAYGDNSGGVGYVSDKPCDPTFAVANKLAVYGNHGGGSIDFVVARNASDAQALKTSPQYANYKNMPQLQGGACYYAVFENVNMWPQPLDVNFLQTIGDDCGSNYDGSCYYLAFDFGHLLKDPVSMNTFQGNVIAGLTQ
jgi:hypothetical protein